jgi:hypothetical protein
MFMANLGKNYGIYGIALWAVYYRYPWMCSRQSVARPQLTNAPPILGEPTDLIIIHMTGVVISHIIIKRIIQLK